MLFTDSIVAAIWLRSHEEFSRRVDHKVSKTVLDLGDADVAVSNTSLLAVLTPPEAYGLPVTGYSIRVCRAAESGGGCSGSYATTTFSSASSPATFFAGLSGEAPPNADGVSALALEPGAQRLFLLGMEQDAREAFLLKV